MYNKSNKYPLIINYSNQTIHFMNGSFLSSLINKWNFKVCFCYSISAHSSTRHFMCSTKPSSFHLLSNYETFSTNSYPFFLTSLSNQVIDGLMIPILLLTLTYYVITVYDINEMKLLLMSSLFYSNIFQK